MEEKLGQSTAVLFKYEKLILSEEKTASVGRCGVFLAVFSRPALYLPIGQCGTRRFVVLSHEFISVLGLGAEEVVFHWILAWGLQGADRFVPGLPCFSEHQ